MFMRTIFWESRISVTNTRHRKWRPTLVPRPVWSVETGTEFQIQISALELRLEPSTKYQIVGRIAGKKYDSCNLKRTRGKRKELARVVSNSHPLEPCPGVVSPIPLGNAPSVRWDSSTWWKALLHWGRGRERETSEVNSHGIFLVILCFDFPVSPC